MLLVEAVIAPQLAPRGQVDELQRHLALLVGAEEQQAARLGQVELSDGVAQFQLGGVPDDRARRHVHHVGRAAEAQRPAFVGDGGKLRSRQHLDEILRHLLELVEGPGGLARGRIQGEEGLVRAQDQEAGVAQFLPLDLPVEGLDPIGFQVRRGQARAANQQAAGQHQCLPFLHYASQFCW
jgi:hypothetical protein